MTDPEDVVSAGFSIIIAFLVIAILFQVLTGGDVSWITALVAELAGPFLILVVIVFITLSIFQELS